MFTLKVHQVMSYNIMFIECYCRKLYFCFYFLYVDIREILKDLQTLSVSLLDIETLELDPGIENAIRSETGSQQKE